MIGRLRLAAAAAPLAASLVTLAPAPAATVVLGPRIVGDEQPGPALTGSDRDRFGGGPAVAGSRVVWAEPPRRGPLRVMVADQPAGPARALGTVSPAIQIRVAASSERAAVLRFESASRTALRSTVRTWPLDGDGARFTLGRAQYPSRRGVFVSGDAVLAALSSFYGPSAALYRLAGPGAAHPVALPAGAEPLGADVAGQLVAVLAGREVVVVRLDDGSEVRRLAVPPRLPGARRESSLAVDEDGAVALLRSAAEGGELSFAPAGGDDFVPVAAAPVSGLVEVDGGQIALVERGAGGTQVVTVRDAAGRLLFRGPPSAMIKDLSLDAGRVAWATRTCFVVADVGDPPRERLPAGRCVRTDLDAVEHRPRLTGPSPRARVDVRCASAPADRCRFRLRLVDLARERVITRGRFSVAVGSARRIALPLSRAQVRTVVRRSASGSGIDVEPIEPGAPPARFPARPPRRDAR